MELNIDGKFEGKINFTFKSTMRNLGNFHQSTWKSQNLDFDGILLPKVENVWAYNSQGTYLSWQWKKVKNWKRNWLAFSRLRWGLSWILTGALKNLKNLHFNGLSLIKVYNVWVKKVQRSYVWWQWILMQSLKENWFVLSKMTWGISWVFTSALEIEILMGFFYLK